jgi:hypothetical protein
MRPFPFISLFASLVAAACSSAPADTETASAAQTAAPCTFVATMEPSTASAPDAWKRGRDGWGRDASYGAAAGATGAGLEIVVPEGNAYASLTLSEGPSLRAGRYALSFAVRASRLAGGCPSAAEQWVEVGAKAGAFEPSHFNEGAYFSRAATDDLAAACAGARRYTSGVTVDLARGGSAGLAVKVGSTAAGGGTRAVFDDVTLTCVSGACMECASPTRPEPTDPSESPGCEARGALRACKGAIEVQQDFSVEADGNGRQHYASHERRVTRHETVTLSNDRGVSLTFLRTTMGARLYSAVAGGRELLYQNPTPRVQSNWGQGGFPVFGGVESAWPVEEHGYYGNLDWQSRVSWADGEVRFVATGRGASVDGSPAEVTITTALRAGEAAWHQDVSLTGQLRAENMYYTNIMVDAGSKDAPADIEAILPGVTRAQVHSRGPADDFLPAGANDTSAELGWPWHAGRDVSHINTTVRDWLGLFVAAGTPRSRAFGFFRHGGGFGLAVLAEDAAGFFPKLFCGRGITADASGSGKAYCEVWFSPNARTFWEHPRLGATPLRHAVKIVPVFDRAAFPER